MFKPFFRAKGKTGSFKASTLKALRDLAND
jgi:hypothetical protein